VTATAVADLPLFTQPPARKPLPVLSSPPLKPPLWRKGGPDTSEKAAKKVAETVEVQRALILGYLTGQKRHGANASEVDDAFGWPTGRSGRRLGELAKEHPPLTVRTTEKRPTALGCQGYVYVVPEWA
jgi:hypothetical protein